jgi:hypothetical protein
MQAAWSQNQSWKEKKRKEKNKVGTIMAYRKP